MSFNINPALCNQGHRVQWRPSQHSPGQKLEYTDEKMPGHHRMPPPPNLNTYWIQNHLGSLLNLMSLFFLDCGRNLECGSWYQISQEEGSATFSMSAFQSARALCLSGSSPSVNPKHAECSAGLVQVTDTQQDVTTQMWTQMETLVRLTTFHQLLVQAVWVPEILLRVGIRIAS